MIHFFLFPLSIRHKERWFVMLANQIRALRKSKEIDQKTLARKLGVTKQTVSNWENDNIMPSIEKLIQLADYFEVSTDYLLGRDEAAMDEIKVIDVSGLSDEQFELVKRLAAQLRRT